MCRIAMVKGDYDGSMAHGGIRTQIDKIEGISMVHEWLPIQTSGDEESSIIYTSDSIILFNGELFGHDHPNDLDLIKDIYESTGFNGLVHYLYNKADGFWSILIYRKGQVLAMTDPLGKKQLYRRDGYGIASEIRALKPETCKPNLKHIGDTIKFGYCIDDTTPYEGITRLFPNTVYSFDGADDFRFLQGTAAMFKFEDFSSIGGKDFRELMDKSVKNRLLSRVPLGLLLSGGLDSSIIAHHLFGQNVSSYCVANGEDLEYARIMDPDVIPVQLEEEHLRAAIQAMEYPLDLGSVAAQYALTAAIPETVILTGDGADELFGGYRRAKDYDSQQSDLFSEIPYYHNIRLDRMAAWHTKEIRSPFLNLDVVRFALKLEYDKRIDKAFLRREYEGFLPTEILNRPKEPLKSTAVRTEDPIKYRLKLLRIFNEVTHGRINN